MRPSFKCCIGSDLAGDKLQPACYILPHVSLLAITLMPPSRVHPSPSQVFTKKVLTPNGTAVPKTSAATECFYIEWITKTCRIGGSLQVGGAASFQLSL